MKHYSSEFRQMAVRLSDEIGNRDAARWLGLSYNTLSAWKKKKLQKSNETSGMSAMEKNIQQELAYLREANTMLVDTIDRLLKFKEKDN